MEHRFGSGRAAFLGYVCGVFWYLGNCYWIYPTMHFYGNLSEAASVGVLFLFALYLGLVSGAVRVAIRSY